MLLAIHQPNYLPWCGYFTKLRVADVFMFLDDAEISPGQSFVYRTRVRDGKGPRWLSVPTHRGQHESIRTVRFAPEDWTRSHLAKLDAMYRGAPFFREVIDVVAPIYHAPGEHLAEFNIRLIKAVAAYLELTTQFRTSSEFGVQERGDSRLVALANAVGADTYLSGKGGEKYQSSATFEAGGIDLIVREYEPVPYAQIHGAFLGGLSIIDAMFNRGKQAIELLRYSNPLPAEARASLQ